VVLHPIFSDPQKPSSCCAPAWPAIERSQKQMAEDYWLVSQPDHAALAGALAAGFVSPEFPRVDPLVARAIEVHDSGWAIFDPEARVDVAPCLNSQGKPISFLEIEPPDFLRAWVASIDRAESVCPSGGYIVSRHFCALGEGRLASAIDTPENSARLRTFLKHEAERQRRLQGQAGPGGAGLEALLLVLQFCDLLSLYLCSGVSQTVEFPQPFAPGKVRIHSENQAFMVQPSPFRSGNTTDAMLSLGVEARRYPSQQPKTGTLAFLLW
jgi:hypothetical protein